MTRRHALPVAAALLAAGAMIAGCSSSPSHTATKPPTSEHKKDADQDAGSAPGADVPGDDDDDEAAAINPAYAQGSPNRSLTVKGYQASINVLGLPKTPATRAPWTEMPKPHPVKGQDGAITAPAQTAPPTGKTPKLSVNVAGLDYATWGAGHPPDTSGAVGPKQFVQTVNTSIGVYSKTGKQLNAFTYNTFFSQFHSGTPCDNENGGDPQVIFDRPANKWIIGDLSYPGPYYFCMAVSDGPNITGTKWTLYPYEASATELNDYPKIGSGPNGLFLTSNMFLDGESFDGAEVWAIQRSSLGTKTLNIQTVRTSSSYGSLLPANSYAATESAGPEYLVSLETSTSLGLWKYDVNWTNPKKSTFSQTPTLIPVKEYQPAGEVPEKDGTAVDSLSDRPMFQLQEASDGTLWFDHSVQVGSQAAVRWYQLGNITGKPTVLQQSTFAPSDGLSRWMGSVAVDKDGNMAVGYSTASTTAYPSVAFATRKATDKKNVLTAEGSIVKGTGSQTGISRWGDYSQMSIDPTNLCTFWYTQEYYLVTGADWQTRIASFTFPGCT
jgi:hypothetical protein